MTDYNELIRQLHAITEKIPYPVSNLSNAAALLWNTLDRINWAGFYFLENNKLVLGPFQGKVACVEIPIGKGVCGTAFDQNIIQVVPDVHKFPGHIACDSSSNSEIVIPLHKNGKPVAVLDIDSPEYSRFSPEDADGLFRFAAELEKSNFYPSCQ